MAKHYVSTKLVSAIAQSVNNVDGYAVTYEDGYESWSPAAPFEAGYLELGDLSAYQPHEQRMIAEHTILADRCQKLRDFVSFDPVYSELPVDERELINLQLAAMDAYRNALVTRVAKISVVPGQVYDEVPKPDTGEESSP